MLEELTQELGWSGQCCSLHGQVLEYAFEFF